MVTTPDRSTREELTLAAYLLLLWRHRLPVIAVTLVSGALAFVVTSAREAVYEGTAKLMVSASKIGDATMPAVSLGTFINLVNNRNLVLETMNELGLTKPPRALTLEQVVSSRVTIGVVRDASIIEVRARFWEPVLAANFANRLAERAVVLAGTLAQQDMVSARDTIKVQLEESRARLDAAERHLQAFQQKAQLDMLTEDTDALLRLRGGLSTLLVEIEEVRGQVARLTEELAEEQPVRDVRRSLDTPVTAPEPDAATGAAPGESSMRLRGELLDPYANPVHEMLKQQLSASKARLAGLEKRRAEMMRVVGARAGVAQMSDVYAKQVELERLRTEITLASEAYEEVSNRYEQARLQVAGRSTQLQLIERALPPESRIGPRVALNVLSAMALAFVVAAAIVLVVAAIREGR